MGKVEEGFTNGEQNLKSGIKRYVYDIVAATIAIVIIAASLHIFDVYDLSNVEDIKNFFVDWVPYFVASILLNGDMYEKGVFIGKETLRYIKILETYSKKVVTLTGERLTSLGAFCVYYNEKSLRERRQDILRKEGISYDEFDKDFTKIVNGEEKTFKPLKIWTKEELDETYGVNARNVIFQAKKVSIKGINVNVLLSSFDVKDPTNIGATEGQLKLHRNISVTIRYLFASGLMSIIFIKDVAQWHWAGIIEVIFKLAYVFARALMSYFKGYSDITTKVAGHITRKTDILNEFDYWYENIRLNVKEISNNCNKE